MDKWGFESSYVLPTVASLSGVVAGSVILFGKVRPLFSAKVNCWFCNTNSKVPYINKNSFVCSTCHQYNGFNQDGSYNRDISAREYASLNPTYQTTTNPNIDVQKVTDNGLCQPCNLNQNLKIKSLAEFTPYCERDFDVEIEAYRQKLDKVYALCRQCEAKLHQTLSKQNSWLKPQLITWRLQQSKAKMLKTVAEVNRQPLTAKLMYLFLLVLSFLLMISAIFKSKIVPESYLLVDQEPELSKVYSIVYTNSVLYDNVGLVILLVGLLWRGKEALLVPDVMCCGAWLSLLALSSCKTYVPTNLYQQIEIGFNMMTLMMTIWMSTTSRRKKLMKKTGNSERWRHSTMHDLSQSTLSSSSFYDDQELSIISPSQPPKETTERPDTDDSISDGTDLDSNFGGLKIGAPRKSAASEFSERTIFSGRPTKILADPKLSKVTQASWVAGGYWGTKQSPQKIPESQQPQIYKPAFTLSRSSSQSSGFVSRASTAVGHSCYEPPWPQRPSFDCQSACSASYFSDPSRPPSPVQSERFNSSLSVKTNQTIIEDEVHKICKMNFLQSWNPWVAFILGVSVTANVFLCLGSMKA